jgi:hypothetical protein
MSGAPGGPTPDDPGTRTRTTSRREPERGRAHRTARGVGAAWGNLTADQRLAAVAAIALLLSMLLPWYQETGNALVNNRLVSIDNSKNAFQVYSFVEAAVFVVSAGVLALLYARGNRRAFHLPGGDGTVIIAAGLWVMFLVFYRQLDKPNGRHAGPINTSIGVEWGIFVAFLLGALLAYAGFRIRQAHTPEPVADDAPPPPRGAAGTQSRPDPAPWLDEDDDAPTRPADTRTSTSESTTLPDRPRPRRTATGEGRRPVDGDLDVDEPAEYRPPPRKR